MKTSVLGKIFYGSLFTIVLPLLLFIWARATSDIVKAPVVTDDFLGILAAGAGGIFMAMGMITLIVRGKGLPMNAYPPTLYVKSGIYAYVSHPIYIGFCACAIGTSIVFRSSSGLWLVSPILILGCVALVYGYEHHNLRERFGDAISRPVVSLPPATDTPATDRKSTRLNSSH